jgi:hypothetical protein
MIDVVIHGWRSWFLQFDDRRCAGLTVKATLAQQSAPLRVEEGIYMSAVPRSMKPRQLTDSGSDISSSPWLAATRRTA